MRVSLVPEVGRGSGGGAAVRQNGGGTSGAARGSPDGSPEFVERPDVVQWRGRRGQRLQKLVPSAPDGVPHRVVLSRNGSAVGWRFFACEKYYPVLDSTLSVIIYSFAIKS